MRILGKKMGVFVDRDGIVETVGMSTGCTISVNADMVEVASDGRGRRYVAGRYGYTLQIEKLYGGDSMEAWLVEAMKEGKELDFVVSDGAAVGGEMTPMLATDRMTLVGKALVSGYTMNAPVEGYATASVSMQGTGELSVVGNTMNLDLENAASAETGLIDLEDADSKATGLIDLEHAE